MNLLSELSPDDSDEAIAGATADEMLSASLLPFRFRYTVSGSRFTRVQVETVDRDFARHWIINAMIAGHAVHPTYDGRPGLGDLKSIRQQLARGRDSAPAVGRHNGAGGPDASPAPS